MKNKLLILFIITALTVGQSSNKEDSKKTANLVGSVKGNEEIAKSDDDNQKSHATFPNLNEISKINWTKFLDNSKISIEEIEISKDTVINDYIKSIIDNDSVQILEYSKFRYEEIVDERCVYIDYRMNTELKLQMSNFPKQLPDRIRRGEVIPIEYPVDSVSVENSFDEFNNIYLTTKSLKNHAILFQQDMYYPIFINDTSMIFSYMDGWYANKFNKVEKVNSYFNFFIYEYDNSIRNYSIKTVDLGSNIQVWKIAEKFYSLKIPLAKAMRLPVLHILFTGGLDDIYENFDKLNLEEIYNN